jgi:hypothetical protein
MIVQDDNDRKQHNCDAWRIGYNSRLLRRVAELHEARRLPADRGCTKARLSLSLSLSPKLTSARSQFSHHRKLAEPESLSTLFNRKRHQNLACIIGDIHAPPFAKFKETRIFCADFSESLQRLASQIARGFNLQANAIGDLSLTVRKMEV